MSHDTVLKQLSSSGLRLEHMLTVMNKTKSVPVLALGEGSIDEASKLDVGIAPLDYVGLRDKKPKP